MWQHYYLFTRRIKDLRSRLTSKRAAVGTAWHDYYVFEAMFTTLNGSEFTLYRPRRQARQLAHRRLERAPHKRSKPRALVATAPDQIYCWDIT